jgi:hypothetical protein
MHRNSALIKTLFFLLAVSCRSVAYPQYAQARQSASPTLFQYLVEQDVSRITISADFTTLFTERKKPLLLDAVAVLEKDGVYFDTMELKIELRGRNRRKVCEFPPLRLDFSKDRLAKKGLSEIGDKLKLVTHCNDEYGSEYLLREYWGYRMYNEITPFSFQAHLAHIRYVDTGAPDGKTIESLAFLIESEEELAARLRSTNEDLWGMLPNEMEPGSYHRSILFQYMIGNDDWGLTMPRNISFFKMNDGGLPVVIPYDFDFSGLVNAPYAVANPNYDGKTVLDRVVIEPGASKQDLEAAANDFFQARDQILNCYENCKWMTEDSKRHMDDYLVDFFEELERSRKIERLFLSRR